MKKSLDVIWILLGLFTIVAYLSSTAVRQVPPPRQRSTACDDARLRLQKKIRFHERQAATKPYDWIHLEQVALAELGLAHLTGDYAPYTRAKRALDEAFARAPEGAGPFLTRARLAFALHRLDAVEPDLAKASQTLILDADARRTIEELRAAVLLQRGELEQAERGLSRLLDERSTVTALSRLAQVRWKSGDFGRAEALFVEAQARTPPAYRERRAWLELMRGLLDLDRHRIDEADAHYRAADATFPGWYLIEEHIAEAVAARGQLREARARYEALVTRTRNPEFMDALAAVYSALGRDADAEAMTARARKRYEARLATFPEAASGHALDHFMASGDIERAVALAEDNAARRPNGEALTKLAVAYQRAGRLPEALTSVDRALAGAWATPELLSTAAAVYEAVGATPRAVEARARYRTLIASP